MGHTSINDQSHDKGELPDDTPKNTDLTDEIHYSYDTRSQRTDLNNYMRNRAPAAANT
jgi:hypothetical protein